MRDLLFEMFSFAFQLKIDNNGERRTKKNCEKGIDQKRRAENRNNNSVVVVIVVRRLHCALVVAH